MLGTSFASGQERGVRIRGLGFCTVVEFLQGCWHGGLCHRISMESAQWVLSRMNSNHAVDNLVKMTTKVFLVKVNPSF